MTIKVDSTEVERYLSRVSKNLYGDLEKVMDGIGKILVKETKRNVSGRLLQIRSGRLLGSIMHDVFTPPRQVVLVVESDTPYSRIHNWGGQAGIRGSVTIKPTYYMSRTLIEKHSRIIAKIDRAVKRTTK